MIKNKYFLTDILKESSQKSIQRIQQITQNNLKVSYIAKKFNQQQKKYFDNELFIYNVILKDSSSKGFAQLKDIIQQKQSLYLVFNQLGQNVESLKSKCGGRLTLKTVLLIGLQLLDRIQHIHSKGYVHRDVQPANFLIGLDKLKHKIYLVDFQFSHPYVVNQKHISQQHIQNFSGSVKFCSIEANNHKSISRKDDLQSLIYSLIYLVKGQLPWFNLKSQTLIEAYNQIMKLKRQKVAELLQGLPQMFRFILNYTKQLKFDQKPNYDKIRKQFLNLMKKNGYQIDYKYDWTYI